MNESSFFLFIFAHVSSNVSGKMQKNTTIKDIARLLNLHHTTVSRALRNHPDVNEETRARVLKASEKLHYVANTFASGLRGSKSKVIGVMVPDIRPHFFSGILSHLTNLAFKAGYSIMIFQSNEEYEVEKLNALGVLQNRVAGVLASVSYKSKNYDHFLMLEKKGIPVVFFDRVPDLEHVSKVAVDVYSGTIQAVEHLLKTGKKRIAFYAGIKEISVFKERFDGYKAALKKHSIALQPQHVLYGGIVESDGIAVAEKWMKLSAKPDAVICSVDRVALGMLYYFQKNHIKVPSEIAVIGFDNDPAGTVVFPRLTTLAQPLEKIAVESLSLLLQKLNDHKIEQSILLKMELIKRESA